MSQLAPVKSDEGQAQVKPAPSGVQVPPFIQGSESHGVSVGALVGVVTQTIPPPTTSRHDSSELHVKLVHSGTSIPIYQGERLLIEHGRVFFKILTKQSFCFTYQKYQ